jgi:hypothetical protein
MIRELGAEDLHPLLELYEQFGHGRVGAPMDPAAERERLERTWKEICASPAVLHLGVFDGARLLATAHASITPNLTRGARPTRSRTS